MEEASQKVKTDEILTARAICNLHSCYMKNALVFSQSDARIYLSTLLRVYQKKKKTKTGRSLDLVLF